MTVVSVIVIIAFVAFLVLSAAKFAKYSKYTTHSRFELYPVPKEGKVRAEYGGSYFEDNEWWTKERKIDRTNETIDIGKEMFAIKKLFDNQRSLWAPSMLFHGGIYVMMGWSFLMLISVIFSPGWYITITNIVGVIGFTCATLGSAALLLRRCTDAGLRPYTTKAEYFNLTLILVTLLTGIYCWLGVISPFIVAKGIFTMTLGPVPPIVIFHLALVCVLLVYIPASKMGHYAGKFYAFRSVLWDNDPNTKGSKVEQNFRASAAKPTTTTWSAHTPAPATDTEE